jgi:predicted cupin superfamily sugar epimerase
VAPGFLFSEFEIAKAKVLLEQYGHSAIEIQTIHALTRS